MKKIIGYQKIDIKGNNGQPDVNGYTIHYTDDEIDLTDGVYAGQQFISAAKVRGEIQVGSEFEFTFRPAKDQNGRLIYRVSGLVVY